VITYRVKTRCKNVEGTIHSIDIFRTARETIAFLDKHWKGMFCKADYRTILNMRPSEFLSVRDGGKSVSIHCYKRECDADAFNSDEYAQLYPEEEQYE